MPTTKFTPCDEASEHREYEFRGGRRDWRRWWEDKAEAFDPDKWKAMASAWWSMMQDAAKEAQAEQRPVNATKSCPYCAEEIKPAAIKCKHCRTWLAPVPEAARYDEFSVPSEKSHTFATAYAPQRLTRSTADATAAGVLSGLGRFLGVDPTWLRIAYAFGTVFTAVIPGIVIYAILAVIIPGDAVDDGQGLV